MDEQLSMGNNARVTASASWLRTMLIGRKPRRTLLRIAVLLVLTLIISSRSVLVPIRVEGVSMFPTYKEHRVNFVNRLAYLFHEPRRGDVVAIRTTGLRIMYMKRIVALPGETIAFHDGCAIINGKVLDEPYVTSLCNWELPRRTLGPNEYFFVGDNRSMAASEHYKGKAERNRIVGKILL